MIKKKSPITSFTFTALVTLLSFLLSVQVMANEDVDAIISEGIKSTPSIFIKAWYSGRCDPDTGSFEVKKEQLPMANKHPKYAPLFQDGILEIQPIKNKDNYLITASEKCRALNDYYFETNSKKLDSLKKFYEMDKGFIAKYGFSVLDAIWAMESQTVSFSGNLRQYRSNKISTMKRKGLINFYQQESTFNGKPRFTYYYCLSDKGSEFRSRLLGQVTVNKIDCNPG